LKAIQKRVLLRHYLARELSKTKIASGYGARVRVSSLPSPVRPAIKHSSVGEPSPQPAQPGRIRCGYVKPIAAGFPRTAGLSLERLAAQERSDGGLYLTGGLDMGVSSIAPVSKPARKLFPMFDVRLADEGQPHAAQR
jgi:hypothetical protein